MAHASGDDKRHCFPGAPGTMVEAPSSFAGISPASDAALSASPESGISSSGGDWPTAWAVAQPEVERLRQ